MIGRIKFFNFSGLAIRGDTPQCRAGGSGARIVAGVEMTDILTKNGAGTSVVTDKG